uniref:hypothetical protein n=1 Tax=Pseudomonas aeruginosa TaxID=287 RepID=UPI001A9DBE27
TLASSATLDERLGDLEHAFKTLASSATLDERLGDLEHAFKPDLDGTESAKPASPPPKRFKLAPLGSVVRKKECATSSLPDEQSSCAALEFCTDCAQ